MDKSELSGLLRQTVADYGQSETMAVFLSKIAFAESRDRNNPNKVNVKAVNPNGGASGIFQFVPTTWVRYGRGKDIFDPVAQCDAVVRFTMDNVKVLRSVLGRDPTVGEYYLAHFAGPGGASKAVTVPPDTPISTFMSAKAMQFNAGMNFRGKGFRDWTAADLREWAAARMSVDLDARAAYAERRRQKQTTAEEDEQELAIRRRNLEAFGVDKTWQEKLGGAMGILGDIFMAIMKFFMGESAPASEREQESPDQVAMRSVQRVQVAASGISAPARA